MIFLITQNLKTLLSTALEGFHQTVQAVPKGHCRNAPHTQHTQSCVWYVLHWVRRLEWAWWKSAQLGTHCPPVKEKTTPSRLGFRHHGIAQGMLKAQQTTCLQTFWVGTCSRHPCGPELGTCWCATTRATGALLRSS